MDFRLRLKIREKAYPYLNKKKDKDIVWGGIYLGIYNESGRVRDLIDVDWDIREIVGWFLENKNDILNELPVLNTQEKSIAEALQEYKKQRKDFEDKLNHEVYKYELKHNLKNALRNNESHDIYIGLNSRKEYEVSYCSDYEDARYIVDLVEFYDNFEKHYGPHFERYL